jgi:DNA topoisomerase-1
MRGHVPRLRRSDPHSPGVTRRRCGRGFRLLDADGQPLKDAELRLRVQALAIPPAWVDVWICPDERGHIQATGVDAAGRRQYRYHDDWHTQRARRKFREMEAFAAALPALREAVAADLAADDPLSRDRVLAAMVRLLDLGFFRIGGEGYAEQNGTYGLATMRKDHAVVAGDALVFDFPAKSGQRRVQQVVDPLVAELVQTLRRRRGGGEELFAYKEGRLWRDVKSVQLNLYLKDRTGLEVSAKDFRTWGATVLCAVSLAVAESAPPGPRRRGGTAAARKRVQVQAIREVARYLGNTPAVCRGSYIDPRVLDRHSSGETIKGALDALGDAPDAGPVPAAVEQAVLELISPGR